jgi:hypothetical protein
MEIDEVKKLVDDVCENVESKLGFEPVRRTFAHEAREGALYFPLALNASKGKELSGKAKTLFEVLTKVFGNCQIEKDSKHKEICFQFTWAATPTLAG